MCIPLRLFRLRSQKSSCSQTPGKAFSDLFSQYSLQPLLYLTLPDLIRPHECLGIPLLTILRMVPLEQLKPSMISVSIVIPCTYIQYIPILSNLTKTNYVQLPV